MKAISAFFILVLLGCGGTADQRIPESQRSGVVFVGDSIFHRWDLPTYFPNKAYVNAGVEGERTDQILARLPQILSGQNVCNGFQTALTCQTIPPPKVVIIYAGWNDIFQLVDPAVADANIQNMVDLCKRQGVDVVLVALARFDPAFPHHTPNPFDAPADAINAGIRSIATETLTPEIPVIPLDQVFAGQQGYTIDDTHPNALGYSEMRDAFNHFLTGF